MVSCREVDRGSVGFRQDLGSDGGPGDDEYLVCRSVGSTRLGPCEGAGFSGTIWYVGGRAVRSYWLTGETLRPLGGKLLAFWEVRSQPLGGKALTLGR